MARLRVPVPLLLLAACSWEGDRSSAAPGPAPESRIPPGDLEAIARTYGSWSRADSSVRVAPERCQSDGGDTRWSAGEDGVAHGRKLFYVYPKDLEAYSEAGAALQPAGQVIVKETFSAREVPEEEARRSGGLVPLTKSAGEGESGAGGVPRDVHWIVNPARLARRSGKLYAPDTPTGLYIMVKGNPADAGTDGGWLYAVTSMDGRVVHANGRLESCVACHVRAPRDRMFGLSRVAER